MKKLLILGLFILSSFCAISQRKLSGLEPTTGRPGFIYLDTPRNQYVSHPLIAINDSTYGMDTGRYYISTIVKNATRDSIIFTFADGTRIAVKDSTGGGGGGAGWDLLGNSGTDTTTDFVGTIDDKSIMFRTNNINRGILKNDGWLLNNFEGQTGNIEVPITITNKVSNKRVGVMLKGNGTVSYDHLIINNPTTGNLEIGQWWGSNLFTSVTIKPFGWLDLSATEGTSLLIRNGIVAQGAYTQSLHAINSMVLETYSDRAQIIAINSISQAYPLNISSSETIFSNTFTSIPSAKVSITSTTQGFLPPRMTKTQRDAIASAATGLMIYQTDNTPGLRVYNGTNWMKFTETAD